MLLLLADNEDHYDAILIASRVRMRAQRTSQVLLVGHTYEDMAHESEEFGVFLTLAPRQVEKAAVR